MLTTISNFGFAIATFIFLIFSIIKTGGNLLADLKKPYLGFASTYLFNYFISCFLIMLQIFFALTYILCKIPLDSKAILFIYCAHTYAIYQGTIFLIKKYNFTKIKNELILTSILQLVCYLNIAFACCCPCFRVMDNPNLIFNSYPELVYYLLTGLGNYVIFQESNDFIYSLLVDLKLFPLLVLGMMWVKSIGKSYYKKSHSYFVKSANHPIFFFLFYEFLLVSLAYYRYHNTIELSILIAIIFILKSLFVKKILYWLRNKDMEEIETNAMLRSKNGTVVNI